MSVKLKVVGVSLRLKDAIGLGEYAADTFNAASVLGAG